MSAPATDSRIHWTKSRWFALADLVCAATSGFLWYATPQLGPWPLLIGLAPWLLRLLGGRWPFQRTSLDAWMLLFLFSGGIGIWASYNPAGAWNKFWLLVGGVLIYYALAGQPRQNLLPAAGGAGLLGLGVMLHYVLTHDWLNLPTPYAWINGLGASWMQVRPDLDLAILRTYAAAGILAMLLPVGLAASLLAWQSGRKRTGLISLSLLILMAAGLLLTGERSAWAALAIGCVPWLAWEVYAAGKQRLGEEAAKRAAVRILASLAGMGVIAILAGVAFYVLNGYLPGLGSAIERLGYERNTLSLIQDFPFTGGGLVAFAGLYSTYIRVIPVIFANYSLNLFSDIALEQGLLGLTSLLVIWGWSAGVLIRSLRRDPGRLSWALLSAFLTVLLHSLVDDPLYGGRGTPFLFFLPGLFVAVRFSQMLPGKSKPALSPAGWTAVGAAILLLIIGIAANLPRLQGAWQANLGAVELARQELSDFPSGEWPDGSRLTEFSDAIQHFQSGLRYDPAQRTAHHRLGWLAYQGQDMQTALQHLRLAYSSDPQHRGIQKLLGWTLAWLGYTQEAANMLTDLPDVRREVQAYIGWWQAQGHPEYAQRAADLLVQLNQFPAFTPPSYLSP